MSTVAFIGLGAMGSRMAMNLHAAGHSLRVFNRSRDKTKQFADKGIEVCDSPAAAAKGAEFVCSIVSDTAFIPSIVVATAASPVRASSDACSLIRSASCVILATSAAEPVISATVWLA